MVLGSEKSACTAGYREEMDTLRLTLKKWVAGSYSPGELWF